MYRYNCHTIQNAKQNYPQVLRACIWIIIEEVKKRGMTNGMVIQSQTFPNAKNMAWEPNYIMFYISISIFYGIFVIVIYFR